MRSAWVIYQKVVLKYHIKHGQRVVLIELVLLVFLVAKGAPTYIRMQQFKVCIIILTFDSVLYLVLQMKVMSVINN